jgi:hypothetical protein
MSDDTITILFFTMLALLNLVVLWLVLGLNSDK